MKRDCAYIAMVACLAFATGCQKRERAVKVVPELRAKLAQRGAKVVPIRDEPAADRSGSPEEARDDTTERARRVSPSSPEAWLAQQAEAAWSGKRDRAREPTASLSAPWPPQQVAAVAPPDAGASGEEEATERPVDETATLAVEPDGGAEEFAKAESPEEAPSKATDESEAIGRDRWRQIASLLGEGAGYRGAGAGEAGYTGVGGGEGFTGTGAGAGYTGVGAGPGFTGMFASASSSESSVSLSEGAPGASPRSQPKAVVIWVPTLLGPWQATYVLR